MLESDSPVAIITGAAKRIGRAIAEKLHQQGYNVVLHCHHSIEIAEGFVSELCATRSGSAITCVADLSYDGPTPLAERCEALLDSCFGAFGRCDVLVNNASSYFSTPLRTPAEESNVSQWGTDASAMFGSNAMAPLFLTMAFARRGQSIGGDRCVVNLCDSMVGQPLLGYAMYTMAKHALHGLTKAAALELAPVGIRVNGVAPGLGVLAPGMTEEEKHNYRQKVPLGRREATPEEIAEVVAFVVSERAVYMTGSIIDVDGGWSLTRA